VAFGHVWLLLLLPLAALPWWRSQGAPQGYPSLARLPVDGVSKTIDVGLRVAASLAIGLSAPFVSQRAIEHVGRGAQIAVLLDRSLSMDQLFALRAADNSPLVAAPGHGESKGAAARRLLVDFVQHRAHDLIGMLVFSTVPLRVLDFTDKLAVVRAAIEAGDIGHGLGETDVGGGLIAAISLFANRPYNGSRVILLVSDGGARVDDDTGLRIAELMKRERIALYWLYLRTARGPRILADRPAADAADDSPERRLHEYFMGMGTPYHAYEAEDPEALARAMGDIDRLQSLPIRYRDPAVRRDLSPAAYGVALACTLLMALAGWSEARRWA
jgi:mxaC protein